MIGVIVDESETEAAREFIERSDIGIHMHWLCLDEHSPKTLDEADFRYDSPFGYNETVGYRGGTTQVLRPMGVRNLFEAPYQS